MKMILVGVLLVVSSGAAMAQKEPLQPAPVPGIEAARGAPADRAGRSDGADNSAPFSSAPTGMTPGNGQGTPQTQSSTVKDEPPTPSLSR